MDHPMNGKSLVMLIVYFLFLPTGNALQFLHSKADAPASDSLLKYNLHPQSHMTGSNPRLTSASIPPVASSSLGDPYIPMIKTRNPVPELIKAYANDKKRFGLKSSSYDLSQFSDSGKPHTAFLEPVPSRDNSTLTLGYLVVDRQGQHVAFRGWKVVSGALSYAIEKINNEGIVPGYNLTYVIRDIRGLTNDSLMEMSKLWRDGVVGFIGPANTCKNEALLAAAWNLPILSHVSFLFFFFNFTSFVIDHFCNNF